MAEHNQPIAYREGNQVIFRMSAYGGCIKSLAAALAGVTPAPPPARLMAAFQAGHDWEDAILNEVAHLYGVPVENQQAEFEWTVGNYTWRGHPDGTLNSGGTEFVVDAKNLGASYSRSLALEGLHGLGPLGIKYAFQGWLYCMAHDCDNFILAARNKEDDTVSCYEYDLTDLGEVMGMGHDGVLFKATEVEQNAAQANLLAAPCGDEVWGCPYFFLHVDEYEDTMLLDGEGINPLEEEVLAGLTRSATDTKRYLEMAKAAEKISREALANWVADKAPLPDELTEDTKADAKYTHTLPNGTKISRYQSNSTKLNKVAMVDDGIDLDQYTSKSYYTAVRITPPKETNNE